MKNLKRVAIIILVISIIILIKFTWSKYITEKNGQIKSDIAQFNFDLTNGTVQETGDILFSITRNDENPKVAKEILAPGTFGEFKIGIDVSRNKNYYEI